MRSYEALQTAINGKTVEHAKKLGLSTAMVNKWQEPHTDYTDSGAYNPLDRIETVILTSLTLGVAPEKALAPVNYLAERFRLIVIELPEASKTASECSRELSRAVKEFGDLMTEAGKRLEDGSISKADARAIDKEAWELIRQVAVFNARIQEAAR